MVPARSAALAAALCLSVPAAPAQACRGGDCIRTAERTVVVERGFRTVIETPTVAVVRPERLVVAPGRVDTVRMPPETAAVLQEVVVQPAGYSWSRTGPNGERCCAVPVAAETKFVARDVVVRPSRRVAVVTPPAYEWRDRVVAVRPGVRTVIDHPRAVTRERTRVRVRRADRVRAVGWIGW